MGSNGESFHEAQKIARTSIETVHGGKSRSIDNRRNQRRKPAIGQTPCGEPARGFLRGAQDDNVAVPGVGTNIRHQPVN